MVRFLWVIFFLELAVVPHLAKCERTAPWAPSPSSTNSMNEVRERVTDRRPIEAEAQGQKQREAVGILETSFPEGQKLTSTSKRSWHDVHDSESDKAEKARQRNLIVYGVLMGFALLLLITATVCFVCCVCFPTGCCWMRRSRLHRAGRVYEKAEQSASTKPKVFIVGMPSPESSFSNNNNATTVTATAKKVAVQPAAGAGASEALPLTHPPDSEWGQMIAGRGSGAPPSEQSDRTADLIISVQLQPQPPYNPFFGGF